MRRERIEKGAERGERKREKRQKGTELTMEEEDKEDRHLPLLFVSFLKALCFPEFPTRFCSKALQQ